MMWLPEVQLNAVAGCDMVCLGLVCQQHSRLRSAAPVPVPKARHKASTLLASPAGSPSLASGSAVAAAVPCCLACHQLQQASDAGSRPPQSPSKTPAAQKPLWVRDTAAEAAAATCISMQYMSCNVRKAPSRRSKAEGNSVAKPPQTSITVCAMTQPTSLPAAAPSAFCHPALQ